MGTNYAVAPGMYLQEWIDDESLTQQETADRLGLSRKTVNGIINGSQPITQETAIKLERVTAIPRDAWLRFEAKYREDLARLEDEKGTAAWVSMISAELGAYMRKHGFTSATKRAPGKLVADFLALVGFGSVEAYQAGAATSLAAVATLKESGKKVDPASFMAWIAVGKRAEPIGEDGISPYDEEKLRNSLPALKDRAAVTGPESLSDIAALLAESGVILQFVDAPAKFPLHGITRWTSRGNPVIQMTGRRKTDGFIIWALFHELGHILCDGNVGITVDCFDGKAAPRSESEKRANAFAKDVLLGEKGLSPYYGLTDSGSIRSVARANGVCPGVAVNLMHRNRMLKYDWCNDLLVDMVIPFC